MCQWLRGVFKALRKMEGLRKKGRLISPVSVDGRTIAKTFWGRLGARI